MSEPHNRGEDGESLTTPEDKTLVAAERGICIFIIQGGPPDETIVAEKPMEIGG